MTEVRVTYRTSLDGELRAFMTEQMVKYLLYIRGQVPCLYDEVLQFVKNIQRQKQQQQQLNQPIKRRLSVKRGIKKAVHCVEACETLFQVQLNVIFSLQVNRESDSRVRTSFVTALDELDENEISFEDVQTSSLPMSREKLMHLCAQKLLRALFTRSLEHFTCALPATKLHIAVLAERQSMRIPGFLPKQQFKLRLPKRRSRTQYLTICSSDDSRRQSVEEGLLHPAAQQTTSDDMSIVASDSEAHDSGVQTNRDTCDPSGMVWYVLEKPIAGFSEAINTLGGQ